MELRQLRYFVTLARELHFGRAAARIPVAQSTLSEQITKLEAELGARLLERTTPVRLTAAGESLVPHAETAVRAAEAGRLAVSLYARGEAERLVVGFKANAAAELTAPILRAFRLAHPHVTVSTVQLAAHDQVAALTTGAVDVAFVRPPITDARVELATLFHEPRLVAVSTTHRFADREAVTVDEYVREPVVAGHPASGREWVDFWLAAEHRNGAPADVRHVDDLAGRQLFTLIAMGDSVALTPASVGRGYVEAGVAFVPVNGIDPCSVAVAVRAGDRRELPLAFRAVALEQARTRLELVPDAVAPA